MKSILLSATALTALTATAFAADLPNNRAPMAPAPAAAATWTGFYFGANAGVGFDNASTSYGQNTKLDGNSGTIGLTNDQVQIGLQGGYNYQMNNVVVGIEADITASPFPTTARKQNATKATVEASLTGSATLRGRLGLVFDRTLVYATAGVGTLGQSLAEGGNKIDKPNNLFSGSHAVAVVGGGVDYKVSSNITVGVDALYFVNNGSISHTNSTGRVYKFKTGDATVVRAKINYNW